MCLLPGEEIGDEVHDFFMEFQARHAVEEIRRQVATVAVVLRDGKERELPIVDLVPGDIVLLKAGDLVPADGRLLEAKNLHVRESALTGESLPVEKSAKTFRPERTRWWTR
jgi:Mg2+-importing ATPase